MALTNAELKAKLGVEHDKRFVDLSDGNGLVARWFKTGKISWYLRYRWQGKAVAFNLGSYPVLTLKDARSKCLNARSLIEEGIDPRTDKKARIQESIESQVKTVRSAIEYWFDNELPRRRSDVAMVKRPIYKYILPVIGDVPVSECTGQHWMKAFKTMAHAPVVAGDTLGNLKQALKYCTITGYCEITTLSPIGVNDIGKAAEQRDRVLSRVELRELWDHCLGFEGNTSQTIKLFLAIVMTMGCRSGEVRTAHKKDFDLDSMVWTVPKSRSKTNTEIKRAIPPRLKPVILELMSLAGRSHLMMPSPRKPGEPVTDRLITGSVKDLVESIGHEKWTAHSLRHTLSTTMSELEIPPYVAEKLLGHKMGGVMGVYNKSHFLSQQAKALEVWMDYTTTDKKFDDYL